MGGGGALVIGWRNGQLFVKMDIRMKTVAISNCVLQKDAVTNCCDKNEKSFICAGFFGNGERRCTYTSTFVDTITFKKEQKSISITLTAPMTHLSQRPEAKRGIIAGRSPAASPHCIAAVPAAVLWGWSRS